MADGTRLADDPKVPSHARCGPCGHVWVFAYVPCLLTVFVRQMKRATCPMCGATSKQIYVYEPGRVPGLSSDGLP